MIEYKNVCWRGEIIAQTTFEHVLEQAEQLTPQERLRLMERLAATLQTDLSTKTDWKTALRDSYGITKDDPIERPPQLSISECS